MFKKLTYFMLAGIAILAVSCNKDGSPVPAPERMDEIVFKAGGPAFDANVSTKATVVNNDNLTAFNVAAATGDAGSSDAVVWNTAFSKDGTIFKGGKYWPATNPGYHFYAANSGITVGASGGTVDVTNDVDVVCSYLESSNVSYKGTSTLSFRHIFARIGDVTVSAASGYTLSDVSITITPKTGGTYNIFTGRNSADGTGWSATTDGAVTVISLATAGTKDDNDIYLVPGEYTLTASWTATNGNYTDTFTNKTKTVSIQGGKVNKITTTLGGEAEDIIFDVIVADWGENTIPVNF